jgi:SAM-dependent methyltransferase
MSGELTIGNPKRRRATLSGWADVFPYYAGYPQEFAADVLRSARLRKGGRVYDPWNGSGSTTSAAAALGLRAYGLDINPVMVLVARARLLPASEWSSLRPLSRRILQHARALDVEAGNDSLGEWFTAETASYIRRLERSVRDHLVESEGSPMTVGSLSALASTFYVALFSAARALSTKFKSSNPTWLRVAKKPEDLVKCDRTDVERCFLDAIERARGACRAGQITGSASEQTQVDLGDSTSTRPRKGTIDFILSSPPYCTRIDYTSATRVELAVISPLLTIDRAALSSKMLGSVRVPRDYPDEMVEWGPTAIRLLQVIRNHESHASNTYYLKSYLDYFTKLQAALGHCAEALRPEGRMVLVVQDSRYKGAPVDLQAITIEMCGSLGLPLCNRRDFPFRRSMRDVNSRSLAYGTDGSVRETALVFNKPGD